MITEFFRLDTAQAEAAVERFTSKAAAMDASLETMARGAELVAQAELKQVRATRLSEEAVRKKAEATQLAKQAEAERKKENVEEAARLQARSEKALAQSVEATKKSQLATAKAERARIQAQKLMEASSRRVLTVQERLNRALGRAVTFLGRQVAAAGLLATTLLSVAGAVHGVSDGIETFAGFEHRLAGVKAVTHAVGVDFEALRDRAAEMGETTLLSASEAAAGMELLGRSGFAVREILDAIPAVLDLAVAGTLDLGTSADLVANLLRAFQLEADQAGFVVDVLAATATSANTDLTMLGESFKYVSSLASGLGLALPSISGALGVLANVGLRSEMAGTGLRMAILSLANATPKTQRVLERFGVSLEDVDFVGEGLEEVLVRLHDAGLGVHEAFEIAGARGGNALNVLISRAGEVDAFAEKLRHVEGTGRAMAATMADTVQGALTLLASRFQAVQLQFGTALEPRLRETINTLVELAERSKGAAQAAGEVVGAGMSAFVKVLEVASTHGDALLAVLAALTAGLVALPLAGAIASFWSLVRAETALEVAQKTLLLTTIRIREAWAAMTAAMARNPAGLVALGVAALAGGLTLAAMRSAEARRETERYHAALEAGYGSVEKAAAAHDDLLARLTEEQTRRRDLDRELDQNRARLEQLEPLAARMAEALDLGDAEGFRKIAAEARELGLALADVGQKTAFQTLASEIELAEAKLASLHHETEVSTRSIASLESSFGEHAIDILDSLVERRRDVSSVLFKAREEALSLKRQLETLRFDESNPTLYAQAVNRIHSALAETEVRAKKAETGLAALDRQLTTASVSIDKAGHSLEIFTRSRLVDASRASIDELFRTGQLERAEEILRRLPKDVLRRVFPGQTVEEILAWQRQLSAAFEQFTNDVAKNERAQTEASKELLQSLEKLRDATRQEQALRQARDLDRTFAAFWGRFVDFENTALSNEKLLRTAIQAGLDPLRFLTGEYSDQVGLLVRQLTLESAINDKTDELAKKKADVLDRQRELVEAQNEYERNLQVETQIAAERRVLGTGPDLTGDDFTDPEAFLPTPEEMRRYGRQGLVEDFRDEWADGIDALKGLWRTALHSILEEGTISFESLGKTILDIFDDVFARLVDQAIESMFVMRREAEGLQGVAGSPGQGGGPGSFFGNGSTASTVMTVAAIAATAYQIADSIIQGRRAKTYSLPITVGFESFAEGFSGQAIGGNIADATGLDFVQVQAEIRNRLQDLRLAIGGFLEFLPELAIQVRRDGEAFKLSVGGVVISAFDTLEEAIRAGLEFSLRDADFSGLGRNMQALLDRLTSIGVENADPFFELARALDQLGVNEITIAFQDLNTQFSVNADRVRQMGGSEADLLRLRTETLRELGEQVKGTLGQFVEGFQALERVRQLIDALKNAEAFNAGLASEGDFRDRFLERIDETTSGPAPRGGGSGRGRGDGRGDLIALAATLDQASVTASESIGRAVTAMGELQVGVAALPDTTQAALAREQAVRTSAGAQAIDSSTRAGRAVASFGRELAGVESPMSTAGKSIVDLGSAARDIAVPIARLPDELRDAAADIPPAIDAAFAHLAIENEADRLQASLSSGLADFLGNEEQRREAERLTHELKLAQMRMELEALRVLAQETGIVTQDVIDRYDRLLTDAERRLESGQGPRRPRRQPGAGDDSRERRRDELAQMLDELRSGLTGTAVEIGRTRQETERLAGEMRELGFAESDVTDFEERRRQAEAARARETQVGLETELARLAGDQERVALLEREAALARIDAIEREMESLHQLGLISDAALADAHAAAEAARQGVNDTFEAEHGLQTRRRAYMDELARLVPEIGDVRAFQDLRDFLAELPQRAEELGLASERLRNQVTRGLELNFFDALGRFSGFDNDEARAREQELRDRQALMNLRLQLSLLEQFGNLSEAQIETYRGFVAEVEAGLENGKTVVDRDQIRQELAANIPSLADLLEVEKTITFFSELAGKLRSIGATEDEIVAARQEAADTLFAGMLDNLARATGNEEALSIAAQLRHEMEVANYRMRLALLEEEGILTAQQAELIEGLINDFEAQGPGGDRAGPLNSRLPDPYANLRRPREEARQGTDPERLRNEIEKILDAWRDLPLDDVTREAQDLLRQRAELEEKIAELARTQPGAELPNVEEAFTQARESFLDRVLGSADDADLDDVSRELAEIFSHFQSVRSALEELGGSAADFGRVAEAESRRLAEFEERLFSPVDAELEALRGVSRSDSENRGVLVDQFREAISRFKAGDLSAAADAVKLSQDLRSQIDQLQIPGERQALLSFLESQLSALREAGIPDEALDAQDRLADASERQLETQEHIAELLEAQNALIAESGTVTTTSGASVLGPIRVEVTATLSDPSFQAALERRLEKVSAELAGVSKKLEKLSPIVVALTTANTQRQQVLGELRKSKGVRT